MSAKERKITAYHEGGHALVATGMNHLDPVTKVTILPRGRALGYTMVMPVDDKYSTSRNEILDQLAYALGGRVAEEIIFHDPTTGAANDIEKATAMARKMVTEFGMSERVGAIKLGQSQGEPFLGRDMGHQRDYSEQVAAVVDEEVRKLIDAAHDEAWHVVNDNRHILDRLVLELLEKETLNAAELAVIFEDVVKRPRARDVALQRAPHALRPPAGAHAGRGGGDGRAERLRCTAGCGGQPGRPLHRGRHRRPGPGRRPPGSGRAPADRDHRGAGGWACRALTGVPASTAPGPRRRSASSSSRSVRTPTATGCATPRRGWPRPPTSCTPACGRTPPRCSSKTFPIEHEELVIVRDIPMYSTCEHHLLPFHGVAHIGYIPAEDGRVTGLSKLGRLVEVFARRPQVQEQITTQVADALVAAPEGAGRHRRHRGRAPVHVDARRAEAGVAHHHLRGPGAAPRPGDAGGGDVPAARRQAVTTGASLPVGRPGRPLVLGVVNVTPDSFSDGGAWFQPDDAVAHGRLLLEQGADLLDVGGESTRPGAERPSEAEELRRVLPVVAGPLGAGARLGRHDARRGGGRRARRRREPGQRRLRRARRPRDGRASSPSAAVPYVAMHWRGHSAGMQARAVYDDVVADVCRELAERVEALVAAGVGRERLVLDPGFGFAKLAEHNWELLRRLDEVLALGQPLLVGTSRKKFLGLVGREGRDERPPLARDVATAVTTAHVAALGVWGVRVHDVPAAVDALDVAQALAGSGDGGAP